MKVEERILTSEYDTRTWFSLKVNEDWRITIEDLNDCSEDAVLERALRFVFDIVSLMKEAYDAGIRGETFEVVSETEREAQAK